MRTLLITFLLIGLTSTSVFSQSERVFKDTIYNADFEDTILYSADFTDVLFKGRTNFRNVQFLSAADFRGSQFDSLVDFSHAKFKNNALFTYVHFKSEANFYNTIFDSLTVFTEAIFDSNVIFSRAIFFSKAIFAYSEFKGEMKLNFATLPDIILFDFVKQMAYEIDFTNIYLPDTQPICYISLIDTDIIGGDMGMIKN